VAAATPPAHAETSAWAPLRHREFRLVWLAFFGVQLINWSETVGAVAVSVSRRFFSSTCDSATALRATARCAGEPMSPIFVRSVNGCSNRPSSNFLVRMRVTASSMRLIETWPAFTSEMSVLSKSWAE
jgi:hypothetical protein